MGLYSGMVMTTSTNAAQKKPSFAPQLTRKQPHGVAPIFLLLSKLGTGTAAQVKHGYWSETVPFISLSVTTAADAGDTTLVVADSSQCAVGQVFQNPATLENVLVTGITDATHVAVTRGFGVTAAAAIALNQSLYMIGTAFEEASTLPTSQRMQQDYIDNYTQIFRSAWSISGTAMSEQFWEEAGGNPISKDKTDAAMFHLMDIERAILFGQKYMGTRNGKPIHTMDGIVSMLKQQAPANVTAAGGTTNYTQLEAALDPCFNTVVAGTPNERIVCTGAKGLKVVNSIGRLSGQYQLLQDQSMFGLRFQSFQTTRGTFHLLEHPMFNSNPDWSAYLLALDLTQLRVMYLANRKSLHKYWGAQGELHTDNGIDAQGGVFTSELTLESRNPSSCALITGLTAGAAG